MPFRMRRDAAKWFEEVHPDFKLDFDMYYICLLAGLASNKKADADSDEESYNLIENFPGVYKDKMGLLLGLFLSREVKARGVQNTKPQMNDIISKLVDPRTSTGLSTEGLKLFNKYSFGGYEALLEWFDDKPRSLETFLPKLRNKLEEASCA